MGRIGMLAMLVAGSLASRGASAEPFRHVLISTQGTQIDNWKIEGRDITPDCPTAWWIRKVALHGGRQEGVEIIEVDNGKLRFTLVPTRGMGVVSVTMGDFRLGWDSPVKEIVHPKWINLQSRGGLGWLEGFNEWLVRCGLESNGHPGTDKFTNNVGEIATMDLTLHGRIANLPAQEVEVVVDRNPPYRIHIRGRVDERMFYGPKLELHTEISTEPGAGTLRVSDTITNQGAQPQEFQILYHVNYGRPLLEEGATFVAPVQRVTPFNDNAAKGLANYTTYQGPKLGFIEQVYCLRLFGDDKDRTRMMLQNKAKDRAVSMAFSTKDLPYFTVWKNTAAEKDGYVTGLEPGTNFPYNRRIERQFGRVPKLAPGASYHATIDFAIHVGTEEVKTVAEQVATIQGERKTVLDDKPVAISSGKNEGLLPAAKPPAQPHRKTDLIHRKMVDHANASVIQARTRVDKDSNRPIYHLQPPALWNNDPNGPIFYHGDYHLFYQHNPYGDDWGHMHWGHFKSKDLAHWEHMPVALAPSEDWGEEHCFSGCATVTRKGQVMVIYTSIGKRLPEQWAAVPEDDGLTRWRKHPTNPIFTEKLHGNTKVHEWRDPFVFLHEGRHYLVAGGNLNANQGGQAVVNVYRAENEELTEWKYLGVLFHHPDANVKNIECPNFFKLGDKWVLIVSQGQPVQYFIGSLDAQTMRFKAEKRGVMDYGNYYAPSCMEDGKGRRILWGWVNGFPGGRGWNGCLTLPRILTLASDGQLVQQPAPELQILRGQTHHQVTDLQLSDSSRVLDRVQGDCLEIMARLEPGDAKSCGLRIRRSKDGRRDVTIAYNGKQLEVAGTRIPLTLSPEMRTLELQVFADRSVLEVYANHGICVTRVIDPGARDLGVEVFSKGGSSKLQSLDAWPINSIWLATPTGQANR